jgi:hypothetical protein
VHFPKAKPDNHERAQLKYQSTFAKRSMNHHQPVLRAITNIGVTLSLLAFMTLFSDTAAGTPRPPKPGDNENGYASPLSAEVSVDANVSKDGAEVAADATFSSALLGAGTSGSANGKGDGHRGKGGDGGTVPVPEPSTWIGLMCLLIALGLATSASEKSDKSRA